MDNKPGFGRAYTDFWKRSFDYRGACSLREYWMPVGLHLGLTALLVLFYLLKWNIPFWILLIYLLLSLIPFVALTVRRLRDTGLSGLWALLLLFVGAGTCVVLALCAAGSGFLPGENRPVNLYGPPPIETAFDPSEMPGEDISGPPPSEETFDPTKETAAQLYGPPPSEETFDPTKETAAPLYGPPPTQGSNIAPVTQSPSVVR